MEASLEAFMASLETTQLAVFIQLSTWAFPAIESLHVLAIGIVVGVIAVMDFRLLGIASTKWPVRLVSRHTLPWVWMAFVLAVISGSLMFVSRATVYYANTSFRWKMALLLLAGLNMLIFELITARTAPNWDTDTAKIPRAAKIAATLSLLLWISVVAAGRWVGFSMQEVF